MHISSLAALSLTNIELHTTLTQMSTPTVLRYFHFPGISSFSRAQVIQQALVTQFLKHKALVTSTSPPYPLPPPPQQTVLTFTPTPVYTTGRREHDSLTPSQISLLKSPLMPLNPTDMEGQLNCPEFADIIPTLRGGQITFHGPGQLVVYPILDLRSKYPKYPRGISIRCYVHLLESTTISTLARWGIRGVRTENPGVWEESGERKIAALGVHSRRSITSYGVGLNMTTDLRWFERIVACGLVGKGVTSMRILADEGLLTANPELSIDTLEPELVGRVWITEFARGLFGEGGEDKISGPEYTELESIFRSSLR